MSKRLFPKPASRPTYTVVIVVAACLIGVPAWAENYGAATSGSWNSPSTWTPSVVPGLGDHAYVGSTHPGGAAANATVTLTQDQQASALTLGYGAGKFGTLDLGNSTLTAGALYLGLNGGRGAVTRGTGSFDVGALRLSGSTLVMSGSDRTGGSFGAGLFLHDGAAVTTAATANVSNVVNVYSGSTLTLGADLFAGALSNGYSVEVSGPNSSLDARGHKRGPRHVQCDGGRGAAPRSLVRPRASHCGPLGKVHVPAL